MKVTLKNHWQVNAGNTKWQLNMALILCMNWLSIIIIDTERRLDIFCANENVTFPVGNL